MGCVIDPISHGRVMRAHGRVMRSRSRQLAGAECPREAATDSSQFCYSPDTPAGGKPAPVDEVVMSPLKSRKLALRLAYARCTHDHGEGPRPCSLCLRIALERHVARANPGLFREEIV